MKRKKKPIARHQTPKSHRLDAQATVPFVEHLQELRRRLYYIAASVLIWGGATYAVQQHVVSYLLRPAKGQQFIYTSPGGGIDFLFKICLYSGLIFSLPLIIYNSLKFIEPILSHNFRVYIIWGTLTSAILAIGGMIFGYYLGLPAALHFLLHQFQTAQIRPLVTIQSYLNFVIVYMIGSALLFQLPLLLILINRIRPLKPRRLLHYERWVILTAFILSGLMNPTPNLISQSIIIIPFILMYQLGILLIAIINRRRRPTPSELLQADNQAAPATPRPASGNLKPIPDISPIPRHTAPMPLKQAPQQRHIPAPRPAPSFNYRQRAYRDDQVIFRRQSRQELQGLRQAARSNVDRSLGFRPSNLKPIDGIPSTDI